MRKIASRRVRCLMVLNLLENKRFDSPLGGGYGHPAEGGVTVRYVKVRSSFRKRRIGFSRGIRARPVHGVPAWKVREFGYRNSSEEAESTWTGLAGSSRNAKIQPAPYSC